MCPPPPCPAPSGAHHHTATTFSARPSASAGTSTQQTAAPSKALTSTTSCQTLLPGGHSRCGGALGPTRRCVGLGARAQHHSRAHGHTRHTPPALRHAPRRAPRHAAPPGGARRRDAPAGAGRDRDRAGLRPHAEGPDKRAGDPHVLRRVHPRVGQTRGVAAPVCLCVCVPVCLCACVSVCLCACVSVSLCFCVPAHAHHSPRQASPHVGHSSNAILTLSHAGNFMNERDGSAGPIPNKAGLRYKQHTGARPAVACCVLCVLRVTCVCVRCVCGWMRGVHSCVCVWGGEVGGVRAWAAAVDCVCSVCTWHPTDTPRHNHTHTRAPCRLLL
jgi:hypothetical protein